MSKFHIYAIFKVEAVDAAEADRLLEYSIDGSGDAGYVRTDKVVQLDEQGAEICDAVRCGCQKSRQ